MRRNVFFFLVFIFLKSAFTIFSLTTIILRVVHIDKIVSNNFLICSRVKFQRAKRNRSNAPLRIYSLELVGSKSLNSFSDFIYQRKKNIKYGKREYSGNTLRGRSRVHMIRQWFEIFREEAIPSCTLESAVLSFDARSTLLLDEIIQDFTHVSFF